MTGQGHGVRIAMQQRMRVQEAAGVRVVVLHAQMHEPRAFFQHDVDAGVVQVGVHGVLMKRGFRSGLLLPQVATENHWDRVLELLLRIRFRIPFQPDGPQ